VTTEAEQADRLYTDVWPDYFETQRRDLWYYERLWLVLLRQLETRTPIRVLTDFGSGPGFLLKLAQRRFWSTLGIEPSKLAREHASSIGVSSVSPMTAANFPMAFGTCEAGIATEVLEHCDDAEAALREWRGYIRSGGHLALSVPNDNNPLQRLFGRLLAPRKSDSGGLIQCEDRSRPWIHHTHKHYFNLKSLRELLERCGFEVVWQRTSFPVELLLVLPIPRKWAWKLSRLWPAPPFLWRLHIGRHCLVVARKKS